MNALSFRLRLSLWYVSVLWLVLAGFVLTLGFAWRRTEARLVERGLSDHARGIQAFIGSFYGSSRQFAPGWTRPDGRDRRTGEERSNASPAASGARNGADTNAAAPNSPGSAPGAQRPNWEREWRSRTHDWDEEAKLAAETAGFRIYRGSLPPPATLNERDCWDPHTLEAALRHGPTFSSVMVGRLRVRVLSTPLREPNGTIVPLQVARSLVDYDRLWAGELRVLLLLLPFCLLVAGGAGLLLTDRVLVPLREVTEASARIHADDLTERLPVRGDDELAELARTFNFMVERLAESFERQRRFTADASHELRTPLARIKLATSAALARPVDAEAGRTALEVADRAVDASTRLLGQLLTLARADDGRLLGAAHAVELADVARQAVESRESHGTARIGLQLDDESLVVLGDGDLLQQVVSNLLDNACRHTPPDGQIVVRTSGDAGWAVLSVSDTGEGIAPEHLPHLTERFYRADAARSRSAGGTGLGLAICESIVTAHGGSLRIVSEPGQGTTVTVRLQRMRPSESSVTF